MNHEQKLVPDFACRHGKDCIRPHGNNNVFSRPAGVFLNLKAVLNNFISDSAAFQNIVLFEKSSIGIDSCLTHRNFALFSADC